MTKAVIFDIDGTLLESSHKDDELYREAVRNVLGAVTFRDSLHDYDPVTDTAILEQIFADNDLPALGETIELVRNEFFSLIAAHVDDYGPFPEIPGARELVDAFESSADHAVAIATGGWRQSAETKLTTAGFSIAGIPLASSDDASTRTEIMRVALRAIGDRGVAIESVTYFGDGSWDREACRELGWAFQPVGPDVDGLLSFAEMIAELNL